MYKVESHGRDSKGELKGALNALSSLRATVHAYNQQLAKVLAQNSFPLNLDRPYHRGVKDREVLH